jgi:hypothetical protein
LVYYTQETEKTGAGELAREIIEASSEHDGGVSLF